MLRLTRINRTSKLHLQRCKGWQCMRTRGEYGRKCGLWGLETQTENGNCRETIH